ncbi:MAG TPA: protealysin inhibitor emfourin [Anaerolineales bacterium]|nr:protealysin inhibitor emfourin [Anaerolineales bacterium]
MTTINFERSGGTMGKDLHLELDLNTLPEDESQHLLRLISEADFFNIPEQPTEQYTADEFRYTISVNAGRANHTIHTSDSTMPKNLLPLAKELTMLKILEQ